MINSMREIYVRNRRDFSALPGGFGDQLRPHRIVKDVLQLGEM